MLLMPEIQEEVPRVIIDVDRLARGDLGSGELA